MLIRKRNYKELCGRLDNLERAVPAYVQSIDEKLCGFAEDIAKLLDKVGALEDEKDAIEQFRELGKSLNEGLSNMLKY